MNFNSNYASDSDSDHASDASMSNSFEYDGSDDSLTGSDQTLILSSQSSGEENAAHHIEDAEDVPNTHHQDIDGPVVIQRTRTVHYQGYSYSPYHQNGDSTHYRCSAYRRTRCTTKLYVSSAGAVVDGEHKPNCVPGYRRRPIGPAPAFVDRKEEMLQATDQVCIDDVTLTPTEVWRIIRDRFYGSDGEIVQGATKKQVLGRLYRTRTNLFGREIFGRLEREPLCDVKDSCGLKFFQFHVTYYDDEVQHRIIGWAHPQLLDRMKQRRSSVFVDATYRCVPIQFYQLVIVMLYDTISDLYLPVWYILTTGKTAHVYDHVFCNLAIASKRKLDPAHIVCDFEFAMIKSVQAQFPDSQIVGCLFHFKQALRRKMLKLKISDPEVNLAMREGCIDRLTTMRRLDINLRGIHEVRSTIKRDCSSRGIAYSRENWKKFWKYFKKTWLHKFEPDWWNVNDVHEDIVNRTNNPLERYNRTLNAHFNGGHPDVTRFISVIEQESRENVRLLSDISNRRASAPNHAPSQRAPAFDSDSNLEIDSDSNLEIDGSDSDESDCSRASSCSYSPEY